MKQVVVVGMGPGSRQYLTKETIDAIDQAQVLIGSKRLTENYIHTGKNIYNAVTANDIIEIIGHETAHSYVVMMSGDTGFYSGTRKLMELMPEEYDCRLLPGISSIVYMAAMIGQPWEMAALVSLHGRKQNYVPIVRQNEWTYFLTQGNVSDICERLSKCGLASTDVWIGENLSYEDEKLHKGKASDFTEYETEGLTVMAVNNKDYHSYVSAGIPDDCFIRAEVPMTKRDVRASVVSRMAVSKDDTVYDIGAGTGSVTIELAMQALYGTVYAVERTKEGCGLIQKNADRFGVDNINVIHGMASDVIEELPVPDAVFIGGSGGELGYIIKSILKKNPVVHMVITAVTMETLYEAVTLMEDNGMSVVDIVQIAVTELKKRGRYHMMSANNPVFVIEGRGVR